MPLLGRRDASSNASRALSGDGSMSEKQPLARIGVFDHESKYLETADVRLEPEETGKKAHPLQWDRSRGCYVACSVAPGGYRLIAQALGYDRVERRVEVETAGLRTVILLGPAGVPFLYRGQVKTPFPPQPDLLAIALDDDMPEDAIATIEAIAEQGRLESKFVAANGQPPRHARV